MFYLIIFCILLILAILEILPQNKINQRILVGLSWGILVLVAGLRYETGGDWNFYTDEFNKTNPLGAVLTGAGWGSNKEIGFVFLCSIIKQLGGSVQILFFLVTLFTVTMVTKCLKLYTKYVVFGLLVYYSILYFPLDMICIRQSIAVSICFCAIQYIKKESLLKYTSLIIIASLFHVSSLLTLPLYFLFKAKLSNLTMIAVVVIGCILMLLQVSYLQKILIFIVNLLKEETWRERCIYYLTERTFAVSRTISIGFFLNLFLFAVFMWKKDEIVKKTYGNIFINMFWFSLIIYYYGYEFVEMSYRFRFSYLISMVVLFVYMIDINIKYLKKPVIISGIVLYCLFFARGVFCDIDKSQVQYISFNPYQNYVIYKIFDLKSTGAERLEEGNARFEEVRKKASNEKK